MKDDIIYYEMERLNADGVDFVPISFDTTRPSRIISSFSKEDWLKETGYPKSNRLYWKKDEQGRKIYISEEEPLYNYRKYEHTEE